MKKLLVASLLSLSLTASFTFANSGGYTNIVTCETDNFAIKDISLSFNNNPSKVYTEKEISQYLNGKFGEVLIEAIEKERESFSNLNKTELNLPTVQKLIKHSAIIPDEYAFKINKLLNLNGTGLLIYTDEKETALIIPTLDKKYYKYTLSQDLREKLFHKWFNLVLKDEKEGNKVARVSLFVIRSLSEMYCRNDGYCEVFKQYCKHGDNISCEALRKMRGNRR